MVDIEKANQLAVERMMDSRPVLVGVAKARDVIPGRGDNENLLTHAGPPIGWERMSGPMRGAVAGALIQLLGMRESQLQLDCRPLDDAQGLSERLAAFEISPSGPVYGYQGMLAQGAPGVHFYTLNKSHATRSVLAALRRD